MRRKMTAWMMVLAVALVAGGCSSVDLSSTAGGEQVVGLDGAGAAEAMTTISSLVDGLDPEQRELGWGDLEKAAGASGQEDRLADAKSFLSQAVESDGLPEDCDEVCSGVIEGLVGGDSVNRGELQESIIIIISRIDEIISDISSSS